MSAGRLEVVLRPRAITDLEAVWRYTASEWNSDQADRYLDQFDNRLSLLADNPTLGSDYSHVRPGVRRYQVGRHGVFYRVARNQLVVVRVLHDRMDTPHLLEV